MDEVMKLSMPTATSDVLRFVDAVDKYALYAVETAALDAKEWTGLSQEFHELRDENIRIRDAEQTYAVQIAKQCRIYEIFETAASPEAGVLMKDKMLDVLMKAGEVEPKSRTSSGKRNWIVLLVGIVVIAVSFAFVIRHLTP
jgi:hypothetical protein